MKPDEMIYPARSLAKSYSSMNRHFRRQLGSKRYQNVVLAEQKRLAAIYG